MIRAVCIGYDFTSAAAGSLRGGGRCETSPGGPVGKPPKYFKDWKNQPEESFKMYIITVTFVLLKCRARVWRDMSVPSKYSQLGSCCPVTFTAVFIIVQGGSPEVNVKGQRQ